MAYVPPSRRNKKDNVIYNQAARNVFIRRKKEEKKKPEEFVNDEPELNFPSLGESNSQKKEAPSMDYASSLFKPEPKKETIKVVKDGWVHIRKNDTPMFLFGEKTMERCDFEDFMEDMESMRKYRVLEKEYEEMDIAINGEKYINGWDYENFLKDIEMERKFEEMENESSDEETTDDEEFIDEFN
jgi:hypothetical protein